MGGRSVLYVPHDAFIKGYGWRVSIVYEDEGGHFPTGDWPYEGHPGQKMPWFVPGPSYEQAQAQVRKMNEDRNFSPEEVMVVLGRSTALRGR